MKIFHYLATIVRCQFTRHETHSCYLDCIDFVNRLSIDFNQLKLLFRERRVDNESTDRQSVVQMISFADPSCPISSQSE